MDSMIRQGQIEALTYACRTIIKELASEEKKEDIRKALVERSSMLSPMAGEDLENFKRGMNDVLAPLIEVVEKP